MAERNLYFSVYQVTHSDTSSYQQRDIVVITSALKCTAVISAFCLSVRPQNTRMQYPQSRSKQKLKSDSELTREECLCLRQAAALFQTATFRILEHKGECQGKSKTKIVHKKSHKRINMNSNFLS